MNRTTQYSAAVMMGLALLLIADSSNAQPVGKSVDLGQKAIADGVVAKGNKVTGDDIVDRERNFVVFGDSLMTRKRATEMLESNGYTYVDHVTCADTDECVGRQKLKQGSRQRVSEFVILVGHREEEGTMGYVLTDERCAGDLAIDAKNMSGNPASMQLGEGGKNRKDKPAKNTDKPRPCFAGFRSNTRIRYAHEIKPADAGWHDGRTMTLRYQRETLRAGRWVPLSMLVLTDFSYGKAVISDGFTTGTIEQVYDRKGTIVSEQSQSGVTMPSSSGSDNISVEVACSAYAKAVAANKAVENAANMYLCEMAFDWGTLGIQGGTIGSEDFAKVDVKLPDPCEALKSLFEKTEEKLRIDAELQCLQNPSVAGITGVSSGGVNDDIGGLNFAKPEEGDIIAEEASAPDKLEDRSCAPKTEQTTIYIGKERCEANVTTNEDCSITMDVIEGSCVTP